MTTTARRALLILVAAVAVTVPVTATAQAEGDVLGQVTDTADGQRCTVVGVDPTETDCYLIEDPGFREDDEGAPFAAPQAPETTTAEAPAPVGPTATAGVEPAAGSSTATGRATTPAAVTQAPEIQAPLADGAIPGVNQPLTLTQALLLVLRLFVPLG